MQNLEVAMCARGTMVDIARHTDAFRQKLQQVEHSPWFACSIVQHMLCATLFCIVVGISWHFFGMCWHCLAFV